MKNDGDFDDEKAEGLDARGDAALWNLLGRADQPKAGPYFARRVLREVALSAETPAAPWWQPAALWRACRWLSRLAAVAGTPAAALFLLFVGLHGRPGGQPTLLPTPAAVARPAVNPEKEASPMEVTDEEIATSMAENEASLAAVAGEDDATVPAAGPAPAVPSAPSVSSNGLPEGISEQDLEVIAELDTLREREQNRLWTEDTARF